MITVTLNKSWLFEFSDNILSVPLPRKLLSKRNKKSTFCLLTKLNKAHIDTNYLSQIIC